MPAPSLTLPFTSRPFLIVGKLSRLNTQQHSLAVTGHGWSPDVRVFPFAPASWPQSSRSRHGNISRTTLKAHVLNSLIWCVCAIGSLIVSVWIASSSGNANICWVLCIQLLASCKWMLLKVISNGVVAVMIGCVGHIAWHTQSELLCLNQQSLTHMVQHAESLCTLHQCHAIDIVIVFLDEVELPQLAFMIHVSARGFEFWDVCTPSLFELWAGSHIFANSFHEQST